MCQAGIPQTSLLSQVGGVLLWAARSAAKRRVSALGGRVEKLVAVAGEAAEGVAHDIPGENATLAALAGYAQHVAQFTHGAGPVLNGGADLAIGDSLAEADVHGFARCDCS